MPHYRRNLWLTALLVVYLLGLLTYLSVYVFIKTPDVPASTATLLGTIYGSIGAGAIALWKWRGDKIQGPDK
jgi:hypothetical protein